MYRSILPRATDFVSDVLALQATALAGEAVEAFVLDAEDAFWQVPLHPAERRYYCAVLDRPDGSWSYMAYNRTAQG